MPYEVIEQALIKTSERNGGWKYAKTILDNWVKAKIDTLEKVKAEEINFKNKNNKNNNVETEEEKQARRTRELKEMMSKVGTG